MRTLRIAMLTILLASATQVASASDGAGSWITRFNNGARNMWNGATSWMPFGGSETVDYGPVSGQTRRIRSAQPKQEEPGFFSSLFAPEPKKQPRTIIEWLKQPKPKF